MSQELLAERLARVEQRLEDLVPHVESTSKTVTELLKIQTEHNLQLRLARWFAGTSVIGVVTLLTGLALIWFQ